MSGDDKFGLLAGLCGVLFLILVLVLDEAGVWSALAKFPQATAFVGAVFTGVSVVVVGALLNAHLNRRRDDRLRREEARAFAAAIQGELLTAKTICAGWMKTIQEMMPRFERLAKLTGADKEYSQIDLWPILQCTVYQNNTDKLGLLGHNSAAILAHVYHALLLYNRAASQQKVVVAELPSTLKRHVETVEEILGTIDGTIALLDALRYR